MVDRDNFLQHTLAELSLLEERAEGQYHGVLARMLAEARRLTEMLSGYALPAHARQAPDVSFARATQAAWPSPTSSLGERSFLQTTLTELESLEEAAHSRYHSVLADRLEAAQQEAKMLLWEEQQAETWPRSAYEPFVGIR